MPDQVPGATADSPQPDAGAASSAEVPPVQEVVTEQTPSAAAASPTPNFNMPPAERWEELRQRQQAAEARAQQAEQILLQLAQRMPVGQAPPAQDYWAGKIDHPDPATARFYQEQKAMVDPIVHEVKALRESVDVGRKELAEVKVENFRLRNPGIAPNSEDEKLIATYVGQGYPIDAAKKLALFDRQEQELLALKSKQSSVGQKVAANATGPTASIPAGSGLPGKPGDWRENVREAARKGGSLVDMLNAAGISSGP